MRTRPAPTTRTTPTSPGATWAAFSSGSRTRTTSSDGGGGMTTGVLQLGYLGFEVSDLAAWEAFATTVLGLELASRGDGDALSFRMDDHAHRLFVQPGPADDVAFVGWQIDGAEAF